MKTHYIRHKETKQVVTAFSDCCNEVSYKVLKFDGLQPYFVSPIWFKRMLGGEFNNSWFYDLEPDVKKAISDNKLELVGITL